MSKGAVFFFPEHVSKTAYTSGRERDLSTTCTVPFPSITITISSRPWDISSVLPGQLGRGAFVLGSGALSKSAKSTGRRGRESECGGSSAPGVDEGDGWS
jgi:hypothetical protein